MPDTTTPRAVLADNNVRNAFSRLELCARVPAEREDDDNYLVPQERAVFDAILAALAASAGPLSAERLIELKGYAERLTALQATVQGDPDRNRVGDIITDLLTAYTALAAECAALRRKLADIEADAHADSVNLTTKAHLAAENAALRATVAKYEAAILWALGEAGPFPPPPEDVVGKPKRRYWWRAELRRIAGLQDTLARTPTPEEQG